MRDSAGDAALVSRDIADAFRAAPGLVAADPVRVGGRTLDLLPAAALEGGAIDVFLRSIRS